MSLSVEEIAQVVSELSVLAGGVVQKAYVPRERVLVLELRVPGKSHLLLLSAEPNRTRLHLLGARLPSPELPLPFQQPVRAHLIGRALTSIDHTPGDRVVTLRFEDREGARRLVAELTGRHGNLFLLSDGGQILALAGPNLTKVRALAPGKPYLPPLAELHAEPSVSRFAPGDDFAMSKAIEQLYTERAQVEDRATLRARIEKPLRARLAKLQRTLEKVALEAARGEAAEVHRVAGELLKVNLHAVRRGATQATLIDYSSGEPLALTLALKPELSPADNLAWHFHQYRRLLQGAERASARLTQLREERSGLEGELAEIAAMDLEALEQRTPASPSAPEPRRRSGPEPRKLFRELIGHGGRRILVGKGAGENDTLTFKHARGHDLWLHARGRTGAHVVVPLERNEQVPQELLLDAAALAVHFSDAKGELRAEVSYLPARYLRKPKGGKPGQVFYSQEKTLTYVDEPARIARLLGSAL